MYSEFRHILFSSMSNPKLFHIKDDKEELSNFEVLKRHTLKFQTECHESLASSSESPSQDQNEDNNNQEKVDGEYHRIVLSKQSYSEPSTPSSREEHKVEEEEEEDGFKTPTSLHHRIPVAKQCPPAPRKPKPSLKRKASHSSCSCRHPIDLSKEVEVLFPIHHNLADSHQSTKKVRREEPK